MMIELSPIMAESTRGWDGTVGLHAEAVPREGDYITAVVDGKEYDGLLVRKVLWLYKEGELTVQVRVR